MDRPKPAARVESTSTLTCWVTPPLMETEATPLMRSSAGTTTSSASVWSSAKSSPARAIMAVGIRSLRFMLIITGSMAPSGRESMSNFSRSLLAAMSRFVSST